MVSERERIAHVVRRLGIGANPHALDSFRSVEDAIAAMLDLPLRAMQPPRPPAPSNWDEIDYESLFNDWLPWWLDVLSRGQQGLIERLTWFWHDHFAVGGDKVDHPYILWEHHRLVRSHATGGFDDLLHAVSTDAAMLLYLDGVQNRTDAPNENFGREVMELHTLGVGAYSQADVGEIARAFTGWVVNEPHWEENGFVYRHERPWAGVFDPALHDDGEKTILGERGAFEMAGALDLLLSQPETSRHVASSLFAELVGIEPVASTADRLGRVLSDSWSIMRLVEEIVSDPVFVSDAAVRAKVRTPLEKAATVLQGFGLSPDADFVWMVWTLRKLHYLPLHPPNPAGFPNGEALMDPARLFGSFELLGVVENIDDREGWTSERVLAALGLVDVSDETRVLLSRFPRPGLQLGLAFGSPEFILT